MPARRNLSGYRSMWVLVMFDLPVVEARARHDYARFRTRLMGEGFTMLQYSIYGRWCPSEEAAFTYRRKIRAMLPPKGEVRVLSVTDRQFGKMEVFVARARERPEKRPEQLLLL